MNKKGFLEVVTAFAVLLFIAAIFFLGAVFGIEAWNKKNVNEEAVTKKSYDFVGGTLKNVDTTLMLFCMAQVNDLDTGRFFNQNMLAFEKFNITCTPREDQVLKNIPKQNLLPGINDGVYRYQTPAVDNDDAAEGSPNIGFYKVLKENVKAV